MYLDIESIAKQIILLLYHNISKITKGSLWIFFSCCNLELYSLISNNWLVSTCSLFLFLYISFVVILWFFFCLLFYWFTYSILIPIIHNSTVIKFDINLLDRCSGKFLFSTLLPMLMFLVLIVLAFPPEILQNISNHVGA